MTFFLEAQRDTLLKPLTTVTGAVHRKHTLPILSNVLIEKKEAHLSFIASDQEIQITSQSSDEVKGDAVRFTVSAKKLQDILRAIPDNREIALEQHEGKLNLKSGKSRFSLQTLPAEDFPLMNDEAETGIQWTISQKVLRHLISSIHYAMAHQDIRYYLNGMLLKIETGILHLVATDGHRLGYISHPVEFEGETKDAILPRKTILELHKLLSDTDEPVAVEFSRNQARFSFSNMEIISKLVDGRFPDYNRVIPQNNANHFSLDRVEFLGALQRANILCNERFKSVRLVLSPNVLKLICTNSEQEEAEEELEMAYEGESFEIGFNITYLLEMMNSIHSETVQMALGDGTRSALMTVPESDCFKYVVMPMRI